jgi:hypothetical protein
MALDIINTGMRLFQVMSDLRVREVTVEKIEGEENFETLTLRPDKGPRFKTNRYRSKQGDGTWRVSFLADLFETAREAYTYAMRRAEGEANRAQWQIDAGRKRLRRASARLVKLTNELTRLG